MFVGALVRKALRLFADRRFKPAVEHLYVPIMPSERSADGDRRAK